MKIRILILSLFYSSYILSSDYSLESTQEYNSPTDEIASQEIPRAMSFSIVRNDLNNLSTARFQIDENLKLINMFANYDNQILKLPILCIGTGHETNIMLLKSQQNIIHENDYCMDIKEKFNPDFVCDCFCFHKSDNKLSKNSFGSIFFAHVGAFAMPVDINMQISLFAYYDLLIANGFLIYNSEVISNIDLHKIYEFYNFTGFEDLEKQWENMLNQANFRNIIIYKKDETKFFSEGLMSILIVAQK